MHDLKRGLGNAAVVSVVVSQLAKVRAVVLVCEVKSLAQVGEPGLVLKGGNCRYIGGFQS
jgi:hypothetical protein